MQLSGLRGKVSLWEGGLFGRLMCSPEAIAALGPGTEGGQDDVDGVSERAAVGRTDRILYHHVFLLLSNLPCLVYNRVFKRVDVLVRTVSCMSPVFSTAPAQP